LKGKVSCFPDFGSLMFHSEWSIQKGSSHERERKKGILCRDVQMLPDRKGNEELP
jgi:hypothetical protein